MTIFLFILGTLLTIAGTPDENNQDIDWTHVGWDAKSMKEAVFQIQIRYCEHSDMDTHEPVVDEMESWWMALINCSPILYSSGKLDVSNSPRDVTRKEVVDEINRRIKAYETGVKTEMIHDFYSIDGQSTWRDLFMIYLGVAKQFSGRLSSHYMKQIKEVFERKAIHDQKNSPNHSTDKCPTVPSHLNSDSAWLDTFERFCNNLTINITTSECEAFVKSQHKKTWTKPKDNLSLGKHTDPQGGNTKSTPDGNKQKDLDLIATYLKSLQKYVIAMKSNIKELEVQHEKLSKFIDDSAEVVHEENSSEDSAASSAEHDRVVYRISLYFSSIPNNCEQLFNLATQSGQQSYLNQLQELLYTHSSRYARRSRQLKTTDQKFSFSQKGNTKNNYQSYIKNEYIQDIFNPFKDNYDKGNYDNDVVYDDDMYDTYDEKPMENREEICKSFEESGIPFRSEKSKKDPKSSRKLSSTSETSRIHVAGFAYKMDTGKISIFGNIGYTCSELLDKLRGLGANEFMYHIEVDGEENREIYKLNQNNSEDKKTIPISPARLANFIKRSPERIFGINSKNVTISQSAAVQLYNGSIKMSAIMNYMYDTDIILVLEILPKINNHNKPEKSNTHQQDDALVQAAVYYDNNVMQLIKNIINEKNIQMEIIPQDFLINDTYLTMSENRIQIRGIYQKSNQRITGTLGSGMNTHNFNKAINRVKDDNSFIIDILIKGLGDLNNTNTSITHNSVYSNNSDTNSDNIDNILKSSLTADEGFRILSKNLPRPAMQLTSNVSVQISSILHSQYVDYIVQPLPEIDDSKASYPTWIIAICVLLPLFTMSITLGVVWHYKRCPCGCSKYSGFDTDSPATTDELEKKSKESISINSRNVLVRFLYKTGNMVDRFVKSYMA